MNLQAARYVLANVLLLLAAAGALLGGGALIWVVTAIVVLVGGPLDEVAGDDVCSLSDAQRRFFDLNLYATLPLLAFLTLAMLCRVAVHFHAGLAADLPDLIPGLGSRWSLGSTTNTAICVTLTGYCYAAIGATVAHELTHRSDVRSAAFVARGLLAFSFNTSFTTFHVHGHHRQVATYRDPATARRGEYILVFAVRTIFRQFADALAFEAAKAERLGFNRYGLRNAVVRGQVYSIAFLVAATAIAGISGLEAAVIAGLLGRFVHELINYVQHFGLVRAEDQPVRHRHSWDCRRLLSNALHYNLPLHAEHHLFASKPFWQLHESAGAPKLPFGYQTMVLVAIVPPLWRRTMAPLLAQWDRQASADEIALVQQRGWQGLV